MNWFTSLKTMHKITLPVGTVLLLALLGIAGFASSKSSQAIKNVAERELTAIAEDYGKNISGFIDSSLVPIETLATSFKEINQNGESLDRMKVISMLKGILKKNTSMLGIFTGWEPNAYDGDDAAFTGVNGNLENGEFGPYLNRASGSIELEPLGKMYESDYYLIPRRTKEVYVSAPYSWDFSGTVRTIVSLCAPIVVNGEFKGVVGTDYDLETIKDEVLKIKLYESGYAYLVSGDGVIVAHNDDSIVGDNLFDVVKWENESGLREAMKRGRTFKFEEQSLKTGRKSIHCFVPIHFSGTDSICTLLLLFRWTRFWLSRMICRFFFLCWAR